jgi:hypothetical protein
MTPTGRSGPDSPWMALVVGLATFVLLFLAFGLVVLPVKAIVMNAAFSASGIIFIKLLGVGMVIALVVDASVVRVLLVPATIRLLGRANWWAPRPLRRLYARYGIGESEEADRQPVTAGT